MKWWRWWGKAARRDQTRKVGLTLFARVFRAKPVLKFTVLPRTMPEHCWEPRSNIRRKSLERYRPNTETLCVVEMFIYISKPLKAIPFGSAYSKMVAPCAPYRTISTVRYRGGVDLRRQIRDIINRQLALGGFYILASLSQWKRVRFGQCVKWFDLIWFCGPNQIKSSKIGTNQIKSKSNHDYLIIIMICITWCRIIIYTFIFY